MGAHKKNVADVMHMPGSSHRLFAPCQSRIRALAFVFAQLSWGILQTLIGFCVFMRYITAPHTRFHGALVTEWPHESGVSLGLFIFVPQSASRRLLVHEYGHCIQSLILGPLFIVLILLPSLVWAGLPFLKRRRARKSISYYSLYSEKSADWLGVRICAEDAMGKAVGDFRSGQKTRNPDDTKQRKEIYEK